MGEISGEGRSMRRKPLARAKPSSGVISTHEGDSGASDSTPNEHQLAHPLELHGPCPENHRRTRSDQRRRIAEDPTGAVEEGSDEGNGFGFWFSNGKMGDERLGI